MARDVDWKVFAMITLNGPSLAALYFIVASSFSLIFGLMRVVNMAHGSFWCGALMTFMPAAVQGEEAIAPSQAQSRHLR